MGKRIFIVSQPHTGTHFLCEFLRTAGLDVIFTHYPMRMKNKRSRCVSPMRDPLLAMISHHTRNSSFPEDNWVEGSQTINALYTPLDLGNRFERLTALAAEVGLDNEEHCRKWAEEWPVIESAGDSELKHWYVERDLDRLEEAIPLGLRFLRENEGLFRPWLEKMGYRDLIWWS